MAPPGLSVIRPRDFATGRPHARRAPTRPDVTTVSVREASPPATARPPGFEGVLVAPDPHGHRAVRRGFVAVAVVARRRTRA